MRNHVMRIRERSHFKARATLGLGLIQRASKLLRIALRRPRWRTQPTGTELSRSALSKGTMVRSQLSRTLCEWAALADSSTTGTTHFMGRPAISSARENRV